MIQTTFTADLSICKLHLTDRPLTNVQTFCKCIFLDITECTSCGGYRALTSPRSFCVIYTVIWALFVLASVSRCWSLSHTQGEVGHLPGSPAAALKAASLAPGQGAAGPLHLPCWTQSCLSWRGTWLFLTWPALSSQLWGGERKRKGNTFRLGMNGSSHISFVWHTMNEVWVYLFLLGMTPICSLSPCGVTSLACHHSSSEAFMTWRISP